MKKLAMFMAVAGLILAANGAAQADYDSIFDVEADFSLSGFSTGTGPTTSTPTSGPDDFDLTNVTGTYSLNIPPAGTSWDVYSSGTYWLDFDGDNNVDATGTWNEYLGNFTSPGPAGIDTHWGPGDVDLDVTAIVDGTTYTFVWNLAYEVDFDNDATPSGAFGSNACGHYTLSGGDTLGLYALQVANTELTDLDNASGGGDGVIDGRMGYTQHITCVPEPATMSLLVLGGIGALLRRRRK